MVLHPTAYGVYSISRPNRPDMRGIVGMLDLGETTVFPHEDVIPSAVATRRADIERAGAFLEPVVVTADLNDASIFDRAVTHVRTVQYDDEVHSFSTIEPDGSAVPSAVISGEVVILDGHHRIAAAEQHFSTASSSPVILAMVVDSRSPGLFVEPQHRVLAGPPIDGLMFPHGAIVEAFSRGDSVLPGSVAVVSDAVSVVVTMRGDISPEEARISALTLERELLGPLEQRVEGYATRESDAFYQLDSGANAVAIMGDLLIGDVMATARNGIILPEKTTCFNPKVAVGLVGAVLGSDSP